MDIRIRKPHYWAIDEALQKGESRVNPGTGLYFRRLHAELDGAFTVKSESRDVFRVTRTEEAVKKIDENSHFTKYRRLGKKWSELL